MMHPMVRCCLALVVVLAPGCRFDASGLAVGPDTAVADKGADDRRSSDLTVRTERRLDQRTPDRSPTCNASSCPNGCCDSKNNVCRAPTLSTCGVGGVKCVACAPVQVCRVGVCEAPDGQWEVKIVTGKIADKNHETNAAWDSSSSLPDSLPDPCVMVVVGAATDKSSKVPNTLTPTWNKVSKLAITLTDTLEISIYDSDSGTPCGGGNDDWIGDVTYESTELAAVLATGKIDYVATDPEDGLQALTVELKPVK
jgi:hypothetical protein